MFDINDSDYARPPFTALYFWNLCFHWIKRQDICKLKQIFHVSLCFPYEVIFMFLFLKCIIVVWNIKNSLYILLFYLQFVMVKAILTFAFFLKVTYVHISAVRNHFLLFRIDSFWRDVLTKIYWIMAPRHLTFYYILIKNIGTLIIHFMYY